MIAWKSLTVVSLFALLPIESNSFVVSPDQARGRVMHTRLNYSKNDNENNHDNDDAMMFDELSWRAAKMRLEDAHTQSFLKRKPVKLCYPDARRWVQANLGAETKDEFKDMVANGNLRTPYIPKNPSSYYKGTGDWISWDHFLNVSWEGDESRIQPRTGKFD